MKNLIPLITFILTAIVTFWMYGGEVQPKVEEVTCKEEVKLEVTQISDEQANTHKNIVQLKPIKGKIDPCPVQYTWLGFRNASINHPGNTRLNRCNKAISLVFNLCSLNPSLDMQYDDIVYNEQLNQAAVAIYCKNSDEKKWKLMTKAILKGNDL